MKKLLFILLAALSFLPATAQQHEVYYPDSSMLERGDYTAQWLFQMKDSVGNDGDYVKIHADNYWVKTGASPYWTGAPYSVQWTDSAGWVHTSSITYVVTLITPPGLRSMYAGVTAPSGWLLEDGAAVSRTTYAALFAVIGTTYGPGNGTTTFNLPTQAGYIIKY